MCGDVDDEGNIIVAGTHVHTAIYGAATHLAKYEPNGTLLWENDYEQSVDTPVVVTGITTVGSDIYVTGTRLISQTHSKIFTIRIDGSGNLLWSETYSSIFPNGHAASTTLLYHADSALLFVCGSEQVDTGDMGYVLLKYDTSGNELLVARYDSAGLQDIGSGLVLESENHIWMGGASGDTSARWDFVGVKFNYQTGAADTVLRENIIDSAQGARVVDILQNAQHEIYVLLAVDDDSASATILIKFEQWMEYVWDDEVEITGCISVSPKAMAVDPVTGSAVITGTGVTATGAAQMFTVAIDRNDSLLWERTVSSENPLLPASGNDVAVDYSGNVYTTGAVTKGTSLDYATVSYTRGGDMRWYKTNEHCTGCTDAAQFIYAANNLIIVSGISFGAADTGFVSVVYKQADAFLPPDSLNPNTAFAFYKNHGQIMVNDSTSADSVFYYTNAGNPQLYVGDRRLSYVIAHTNNDSIPFVDTLYRIDFNFANPPKVDEYSDWRVFHDAKATAFLNYYLGYLPEAITGVEGHNRIVQKDVYYGVDWHLTTTEEGIKSYFVVSPAASVDDIQFTYTGADSLSFAGNALQLITSIGTIRFDTLKAYAIDNTGDAAPVNVTYEQLAGANYGFEVDSFEEGRWLVVEQGTPQGGPRNGSDNLMWSTYYGQSKQDKASDIDADQAGNIYITGETLSPDFPVTPGLIDLFIRGTSGFVSKFSNSNQWIWSTYYGSAVTEPNGIAIDHLNNVYIVGQTQDTGLITIPPLSPNGFYQDTLTGSFLNDGFIARFSSSNGALNYGTYYGGYYDENFKSIAVDPKSNDIFIGGFTESSDFPYAPSMNADFFDTLGKAIILQFDSAGNRLWATGFASDIAVLPPDQTAEINDVTFDKSGNLVVTGFTPSGNNYLSQQPLPCSYYQTHLALGPQFYNSFIAKFAYYIDSGRFNYYLYFSSEFGGDKSCVANCVVADTNNSIYIAGWTSHHDLFPFYNPGNGAYYDTVIGSANRYDAYIAKFDSDGCPIWSTLFGGDENELFWEMDIDSRNNKYLIGRTNSNTVPALYKSNYYFDSTYISGSQDKVFITSFDENDNLTWSTLFGGSGRDLPGGCKIYNDNDFYAVGTTASGQGSSNQFENFPLRWAANDYIDSIFIYNTVEFEFSDGFIARFDINEFATSIKKIDAQSALLLNLFPNPNSGKFFLEIYSESDEPIQVELFDLLSQRVSSDNLPKPPYSKAFNFSELPQGMYLIRVAQGQNYRVLKFIKQ